MKLYKSLIPVFVFLLLSFIIIYPLLPAGYLLTMDEVLTPSIIWPNISSSNFLYKSVFAVLSNIVPSYLLQKLVLFLIFFLSGWGMYNLIPVDYLPAKYFASFLYAVNPFVYERIMAGHWMFLLGYSVFPFILLTAKGFLERPTGWRVLLLCLMVTLLINFSLHFSLIFTVFFLIYLIVHTVLSTKSIFIILRHSVFFLLLLFVFNANWLIPVFIGNSDLNATLFTYFDREDIKSFQSVPDIRFGLIFNLLSGYGFWPEVYEYFTSPKSIILIWPIFSFIIIAISTVGLIYFIRNRNSYSSSLLITLVIIFFISLDFAGGIALKSFSNSAFFLYDAFPILRSFREPQKLVAILLLCFAFFGSGGIYVISQRVTNKSKYLILSILFLLPFIYTPTVFGGFWGQLSPVWYPASWTEINNILIKDKSEFYTLFFPWHQYMRFSFTKRRVIANPAFIYFDKPVLTARNYETDSLYSHETMPEILHIEGLLSIQKEGKNLVGEFVEETLPWGESLAPINVKYILLAKEDDWRGYRFLDNQPDLKKISESTDMIVYENQSFGKEPELPQEDSEL